MNRLLSSSLIGVLMAALLVWYLAFAAVIVVVFAAAWATAGVCESAAAVLRWRRAH